MLKLYVYKIHTTDQFHDSTALATIRDVLENAGCKVHLASPLYLSVSAQSLGADIVVIKEP